jgi:hypothetical protein
VPKVKYMDAQSNKPKCGKDRYTGGTREVAISFLLSLKSVIDSVRVAWQDDKESTGTAT